MWSGGGGGGGGITSHMIGLGPFSLLLLGDVGLEGSWEGGGGRERGAGLESEGKGERDIHTQRVGRERG